MVVVVELMKLLGVVLMEFEVMQEGFMIVLMYAVHRTIKRAYNPSN